ncbi:MAG: SdrD B-like domain-containing protein [Dehalococcoidia bacterium]|jgi:hypothetical protein
MNRKVLSIAIVVSVALTAVALKGVSPAAGAGGGTISGRVVNDVDQDGVAQAGEPGLSGWLVTLDHSGEASREAHTDSNGRFSFSNLSPGDYDVDLSCDGQPSLWGATPGETTGFSFTLEAGADRSDIDFPVVPIDTPPSRPHTATITGRVVLDENRDGNPDNREPGVGGWPLIASPVDALNTVCFSESDEQTKTDSSGHFTFSGLAPGQYSLNEDQNQQAPLEVWGEYGPGKDVSTGAGVNILLGAPVDTQAGRTSEATIGVISLKGTASISGSIYADLNKNGSRDPDEPVAKDGCWVALAYRVGDAYVGVSPFLQHFDFDNPPYHFSGLAPGGYFVGALFQLAQAINPPPDLNYGESHTLVTLSEGQQLTGVDFGFESIPPNLLAEPTVEPSPTPQPAADTPAAATPQLLPGPNGGSGSLGVIAPPSTGGGPSARVGYDERDLVVLLAAGSTLLGAGIVAFRRKGVLG